MYTENQKGRRISTLQELKCAANERRAVVTGRLRLPAAVIINWNGQCLLTCFERGMWLYEKEGA